MLGTHAGSKRFATASRAVRMAACVGNVQHLTQQVELVFRVGPIAPSPQSLKQAVVSCSSMYSYIEASAQLLFTRLTDSTIRQLHQLASSASVLQSKTTTPGFQKEAQR